MAKAAILICIDGCGPEYLRDARFIRHLGNEGFSSTGNSMIPSVTNVNNVSILTGEYPEVHGITSNYYYDRATGREVYMESPDFIRARTLLEVGADVGLKTALLTSKDKLRSLLNRGAHISFSAEAPPGWVARRIGDPPHIYSVDVDIWLLKAAKEVMLRESPDLMYVATTDYAMHKYAPQHSEAKRHTRGIDEAIQELVEEVERHKDEFLICITADHGMSDKRRAVNLELVLREHGICSKLNPIIADRYTLHHMNLGGAVYIYLEDLMDLPRAIEVLRDTEGVEMVLTKEQASRRFHLDEERIGDIMVLGRKDYVFGLINEEVQDISLRSHGSLHEMKVPLIVNLPRSEISEEPQENKDLVAIIVRWLIG